MKCNSKNKNALSKLFKYSIFSTVKRKQLQGFLFASLLFFAQFTFSLVASAQVKVVVLGSSTAWGGDLGDRSWVNLYKAHLKKLNPKNEVINLAMPGSTTWSILPTGADNPHQFMPDGTIDYRYFTNSNHNVSKAISLGADAIIVNMPSNDTNYGINLEAQMTNYNVIVQEANRAQIPVWVATTQPKNFNNDDEASSKREIQFKVRQAIEKTYPSQSIDFWSDFVDDRSNALKYGLHPDHEDDRRDGTHMNAAAHKQLSQNVIDADILSLNPVKSVWPGEQWGYVIDSQLWMDNEKYQLLQPENSVYLKYKTDIISKMDKLKGWIYFHPHGSYFFEEESQSWYYFSENNNQIMIDMKDKTKKKLQF